MTVRGTLLRGAALGLALMGCAGPVNAAAAASAEKTADGAVEAIHAGRLIDPASGRVLTDQMILVRDGKILALGSASAVKPPAGAVLIDLTHATVLPGLIDVHVHLNANPQNGGANGLTISTAREAIDGVANARKTLLAGFTSVRNVGAGGFSDVALRDGINAGEVEGPRMQVSGPPLGATGGHADENLLPWDFHYKDDGIADGPWALRAKVRQNIKYGADVIKFMGSGGVLSHGDSVGGQQLTQEEMNAIVEEAHMWGRKVAVHDHGTEAIKAAIRAGADTIEHASLIDEEGIRMAKARGTWLDMDVYDDDYILAEGTKNGVEPSSMDKERQVGRLQRENFEKAVKAGCKMGFATDAGVYPHGWNAKQFAVMVRWGMTPMQAIRAATVSGAEIMGWSDRVGQIAPGYDADLIAVDADPLADVSALEHVVFVMKDGTVYKSGGKAL
jgi:imidazolonepropionase-like amidohydrolase